MNTATGIGAALTPVRAALRAQARAEAARLLAPADAAAAAQLDSARTEADRLRSDALARGESEATLLRETAHRDARVRVRAAELDARRHAYTGLRVAVEDRLRAAFAQGGEATLRAWLIAALGPAATITAAPGGGLVARAADRTVDASVRTLAQAALENLGAQAEELWE